MILVCYFVMEKIMIFYNFSPYTNKLEIFIHLLTLENKVILFLLKMTQIFGDDAPGILGEKKKLEQ